MLESYPKVWNLGHRNIAEIFMDEVLVEEKVDGSQFSFGVEGGVFLSRSKGAVISEEDVPKLFRPAWDTAKELASKLQDGLMYRAEAVCKPKHNAITYARIPQGGLVLFDIGRQGEHYFARDTKEQEAGRLGLEVVPVVFRGKISTEEDLRALLDRESFLGGAKVEGLVIKNYSRFGIDGRVLLGKIVAAGFRELNDANWKVTNPTRGDVVQRIIENLSNENRWLKAIQHLREKGKIQDAPQDIGPVLKAIKDDICAEEIDAIKRELVKWALPHILRGAVAGFPEWYKAQLVKKQFGEEAKDATVSE